MPIDLPKQYDPAEAQRRWMEFWQRRGWFDADPPAPDDPHPPEPHVIMIPLPNVTGALHMGHALNGTLQDLLTRWRRMQGRTALWMPGTDHAGIATQAVVERRMLEEEKLTRHDIGRDKLVERIWRWKDTYEQRILGQLKQLGASCDWRRTRFTLDEVCSQAVRRTFFKLFRDGLVFRGKRLVNWDTYLQTAVADDEVFEEEVDGHFWTFRYPVVDDAGRDTGESIRFATTRPETMLGDTAVCVHPTDERYAALVGRKVRIPLNGRTIPVIADGILADKEKGTGAVKVTPGHDHNDHACYTRHPEIGIIDLISPDGTINENAGNPKYVGIDRLAVRDLVVADMAALGFFEGVEDRKIPLKHSDRSKTPIEPLRSDQWFVRMGPHTTPYGRKIDLAQSAMDAVEDDRVRFYPARYAKTYLDWLGEKRNWCVSRQLWWGHRIPVWSKVFDTAENASVSSDRQIHEVGFLLGKTSDADFDPRHLNPVQFQNDSFGRWDLVAVNDRAIDWIVGAFVDGDDPTRRRILICVDEGHEEFEELLAANGYTQDPDVLDTWFSSALWPHATLGWPDTEHNPPLAEQATPSDSQLSTLNPQPDGNAVLRYFYPGHVLVTSRDIITLWVARMVLTGLYNLDDVPFKHVCIHPKILDGFGQTMSKSKGNGVDPADLIDKYGTDAVRFTIASFAGETQDVRLPVQYECPHCKELTEAKQYLLGATKIVVPATMKGGFPYPAGSKKPVLSCAKCKKESQFSTPQYEPDPGEPVARVVSERFEYGRNFCNKFWNAARFAMLNLEGYAPGPVRPEELALEDRWILGRLSATAHDITESLGRYQFDVATRTLRDFTWNEFCDWYLEMIKPRLRDEAKKPAAQRVLVGVLDVLIRLLQPFVPFLAEELWQRLAEIAPVRGLQPVDGVLEPEPAAVAAIVAPWPELPRDWRDAALEARFDRLRDMIVAVRNVRAIYGIPPSTALALHLRCSTEIAAEMQGVTGQFENLARTLLKSAGSEVTRPEASASFSLQDADGFVPLAGVVDRDAEVARQKKEAERLRGFIAGSEKKLANEGFVAKAPPEVIAQVRETLAGLRKQLESVEAILADLA